MGICSIFSDDGGPGALITAALISGPDISPNSYVVGRMYERWSWLGGGKLLSLKQDSQRALASPIQLIGVSAGDPFSALSTRCTPRGPFHCTPRYFTHAKQ